MSCLLGGISALFLVIGVVSALVYNLLFGLVMIVVGLFLIFLGKILENSKERNRLLRQIAEKADDKD